MEVDESTVSETEMNAKTCSSGENSTKEKPTEKPRRARDEKRDRKKDDKSVEHVLKALNSLDTTEEKLAAMCKKYADILNNHRMLQNVAKQAEKKCCVLQREKEQLQADHSKAILTRSRLENLCRELQRQNKAVKEESMMRIREEEEKRKEVSAKFQTTLSEITTMMQQNNDKNTKLRDDNIDMTAKLKNVCEQYEKREQHVEKLAKQMQLEMQLADAKLAKAKMEMAVEKETWLREKQQLLLEKAEYKNRLDEMRGTEQSLRDQITLYNNKYDEFHRALTQSNEAITGFKTEMERMSKQIRKLEKETGSWRTRYEQTHTSLLKMTEEKLVSDHELAATNRKLAALQNLCRTLQSQCVQLRTELRQVKGGEVDEIPVTEQPISMQVGETKEEILKVKDVCPLVQETVKEVLNIETEEKGPVTNGEITPEGEVMNNMSSEIVSGTHSSEQVTESININNPVSPGDVSIDMKLLCEDSANGNINQNNCPDEKGEKTSSVEFTTPVEVPGSSEVLNDVDCNKDSAQHGIDGKNLGINTTVVPEGIIDTTKLQSPSDNCSKNQCPEETNADSGDVLAPNSEPVLEKPAESVLPDPKFNGCQTVNSDEGKQESNESPKVQTTNEASTGKEKVNSCTKQSGKKKNKNNK